MNNLLLTMLAFCGMFHGCESGHEIYIEPECNTLIINTFTHNNSMLTNRHFSLKNDTFELQSSYGEIYNYSSVSQSSESVLEECTETFAHESFSYKTHTDDLAPKISAGLWFRFSDTIAEPVLSLIVGSFLSYTSVNGMSAINDNSAYPTNNKVSFHSSLSVMDTTYNEVYLMEKNDYLEKEIRGIVYSVKQGILGFYRSEEIYWKVL